MGKVADRCKILVVDDDQEQKGRLIQIFAGNANGTEVTLFRRGKLLAQTKAWLLETHKQGKIPIVFQDEKLEDAVESEVKTGTELLRELMKDPEILQSGMKILLLCTTTGDMGSKIAEWRNIPGVRERCCVQSFNTLEEPNYDLEDELAQFDRQFPELAERTLETRAEIAAPS